MHLTEVRLKNIFLEDSLKHMQSNSYNVVKLSLALVRYIWPALFCVPPLPPQHTFTDLLYQTVPLYHDIAYTGECCEKQPYEIQYGNYCRNIFKDDIYYITWYLLHKGPRSSLLSNYNTRKSYASFKQVVCFYLILLNFYIYLWCWILEA